MATNAEWYVHHGGKVHGPFTSSQLKQLASKGKITEDSKVRIGEDGNWSTASKVKGLFKSRELAEVKPVPPANIKPNPPVVQELANPPVVQPKSTLIVESPAVGPAVANIPCPLCGEEIKETAIKCRHCNEFLDGRQQSQAPASQQVFVAPQPSAQPAVNVNVVQQVGISQKRWSRLVVAILSLLIPGLGQLYKGQAINGIAWFVLTILGYALFIFPGVILHICCVIGAMTGDPYR